MLTDRRRGSPPLVAYPVSADRRPSGSRRARTVVLVLATAIAVIITAVIAYRAARPTGTGAAEQALNGLVIIEPSTEDPTYRRAAFGRSWADLDGDGCNTRDEVLLASVDRSQPYRVQRQGRCRADMVAGTWTDLYTGQTMTWTDLKSISQAAAIPIDHIVPLAGAFRYGAKDWTQQRRVEFANDELNLTPTSQAINQAKTDKDPADWTPPVGRCAYATRYIAVKTRWDLPVDAEEKAALQRLLRDCPTGSGR